MKYELTISKKNSNLYIKADPKEASFNPVPATEVSIYYDEVIFEHLNEGIIGMLFKLNGEVQNIYITKLNNVFSIRFGNSPNTSLVRDASPLRGSRPTAGR